MKYIAWGLVILGVAVLVLVVIILKDLHTPSGPEYWVRINLEQGTSMGSASRTLEKVGLVKHPKWFVLWARLTGKDKKIQAGSYLLNAAMTPSEMLDRFVNGQVITTTFTVHEGATIKEIASIVQAKVSVDSVEFIQFCRNDSFIGTLGVKSSTLEGYLFPDTYNVTMDAGADRIAAMMVARLMALLGDIDWDEGLSGLSLHEILTLASIVEKESSIPDERPVVAAVYFNRLRIGMKLDADPTVIYALGGLRRKLTYEDLRYQSPYNTYENRGLPPGPICSPGLGCITAVMHPDRGCKALYFVAKGDGSHTFSRTFGEHKRAVARYRKASRG